MTLALMVERLCLIKCVLSPTRESFLRNLVGSGLIRNAQLIGASRTLSA